MRGDERRVRGAQGCDRQLARTHCRGTFEFAYRAIELAHRRIHPARYQVASLPSWVQLDQIPHDARED